ncbi:hypothetical protein [Pseudoxanthomonas winnipegensis]|uniref:hypothetical protein n=1 Tax=Pseudoxanthomonas winnipegensis TaxID=2480810 RepID=UPI0013EEE513|nr:hypothetical protein [Pseudoxanthomonas winnipegensis]
MSTHPSDTLAALQWAIEQARKAPADDHLVHLVYLPALREAHAMHQREARGHG